jgi:AcrR family transcriptional regulator
MSAFDPPQRSESLSTGAEASRDRLHEAVVDLVVERGYEVTTVAMVLERAGVSRDEFDRHFVSKEDACIKAYDKIATGFQCRVYAAYESGPSWRESLRAAAYEAARFFRDLPKEGRFGAYELMRASDLAQTRREENLNLYASLIDAGRQELGDPNSLSRSTAEAAMGSILGVIINRDAGLGFADAESFVPQLMYIAVRPYLGLEAAREELTIPPPPESMRTD